MAHTQPFATYPHVLLLEDGRHVELQCPHCKGNAGCAYPNKFFENAQAVVNHVGRIHHPHKTTISAVLSQKLRELTAGEVQRIYDGYGRTVITKTASNKDKAKVKIIERQEVLPILLYPSISKVGDNKYVELTCYYCNGNAAVKGLEKSNKIHEATFISGALGMMMHLLHVHKRELEGDAVELDIQWVNENCGLEINPERFKQLRKDQTGKLMEKKMAKGLKDLGIELPQHIRKKIEDAKVNAEKKQRRQPAQKAANKLATTASTRSSSAIMDSTASELSSPPSSRSLDEPTGSLLDIDSGHLICGTGDAKDGTIAGIPSQMTLAYGRHLQWSRAD